MTTVIEAFGPEAFPLVVSGCLGGLTRGLVVFRSVIAKGPITQAILVNTLFDTGTSVVIGAIISLFLHQAGEAVLDAPVLNQIAIDGTARTATGGFIAGFGCIAIVGALWDFFTTVDFMSMFNKKGT